MNFCGRPKSRRYGAMAILLMLGGCSSLRETPPADAISAPASWSEIASSGAAVWPNVTWWKTLGSTELAGLVDEARRNSTEVSAAAARVTQAEAQLAITRSALFPTLGVAGEDQIQGAREGHNGSSYNGFAIAAVASYELDFWGLTRNSVRASEALLRSSRYAQETVALSVAAGVAATYLDVLGLRDRIAVARRNLAIANRVLEAIQIRTANGLSSPLDLVQQQALAAGIAAEIPVLEQQEHATRFALAVLLGRPPEFLTIDAETLGSIALPPVAPGLPSELLGRRPDIAQAEANLAAASANVAAARAAFYPQIGLTASGGIASGAVSAITDGLTAGTVAGASGGAGLIYGVGASLLQVIFDGGRRQGAADLAVGQRAELIALYRDSVLRAFADVETTLNQLTNSAERERLKTEQTAKAEAAVMISQVQYREGLIDLFALLQAQQTLFRAEDELVQARLARLQAGIGLYKVLGGGWTSESTAAEIKPSGVGAG